MFYKQIKKKQDGTYEFIGAENPSTSNIPVKKNIKEYYGVRKNSFNN